MIFKSTITLVTIILTNANTSSSSINEEINIENARKDNKDGVYKIVTNTRHGIVSCVLLSETRNNEEIESLSAVKEANLTY